MSKNAKARELRLLRDFRTWTNGSLAKINDSISGNSRGACEPATLLLLLSRLSLVESVSGYSSFRSLVIELVTLHIEEMPFYGAKHPDEMVELDDSVIRLLKLMRKWILKRLAECERVNYAHVKGFRSR